MAPILFPDKLDDLLSERQEAMRLRSHAMQSVRVSVQAYGAQCDRVWRLNVRIARRASA
jgi:hypothetical protein